MFGDRKLHVESLSELMEGYGEKVTKLRDAAGGGDPCSSHGDDILDLAFLDGFRKAFQAHITIQYGLGRGGVIAFDCFK